MMYFGAAKRNACQGLCNSLQRYAFESEYRIDKCMQHPTRHPITAGTFCHGSLNFFSIKTMIYGIFWEEISLLSEYIHPPLGKANGVFYFHLDLWRLWLVEPNYTLDPTDMQSVSTWTARAFYGSCSLLVLHVPEHQASASLRQP